MSRTKIGSSAVALPSSTANRSSKMAPSTTLCWPMKTRPLNSRLRSTGSRGARRRSIVMPRMTIPAESHSTRAGGEDQRRAQRDQQAAERRPGNDGDLRRRGRAGDRARQHARRHDIGQRRLQARLLEGAADADAERHGEQKMRRQPAGRGRECQHRDGKRLEDLRHENNGAPVIAIRRVAGGEEQSDARDELNEPDQAELKWAARQLVHQPADRDGLDLQRDRRRDPHIEEADIGAVAQKIDGRTFSLVIAAADCELAAILRVVKPRKVSNWSPSGV